MTTSPYPTEAIRLVNSLMHPRAPRWTHPPGTWRRADGFSAVTGIPKAPLAWSGWPRAGTRWAHIPRRTVIAYRHGRPLILGIVYACGATTHHGRLGQQAPAGFEPCCKCRCATEHRATASASASASA